VRITDSAATPPSDLPPCPPPPGQPTPSVTGVSPSPRGGAPRAAGTTISPPPIDRRAPALDVRIARRQRVLRARGVVLSAGCDEWCTVFAGGRLQIGRRSYKLSRASRSTRPGRRASLEVRLTRRATRALRQALRQRRRSSVRIRLGGHDAAGNRSALVRVKVRAVR
jgi:hypothetical protein